MNLPRPRPAKHAAEIKREQLRDQLFPSSANEIYDRNIHGGFSTVPRTIGLILTLLEQLAAKGKNVSRVYSELWFRTIELQSQLRSTTKLILHTRPA
jgi:hypothetical protein